MKVKELIEELQKYNPEHKVEADYVSPMGILIEADCNVVGVESVGVGDCKIIFTP